MCFASKAWRICYRRGRGPKSANLCSVKLSPIHTRSENMKPWQKKRKGGWSYGHERFQMYLGKPEIRSDQKLKKQGTHWRQHVAMGLKFMSFLVYASVTKSISQWLWSHLSSVTLPCSPSPNLCLELRDAPAPVLGNTVKFHVAKEPLWWPSAPTGSYFRLSEDLLNKMLKLDSVFSAAREDFVLVSQLF